MTEKMNAAERTQAPARMVQTAQRGTRIQNQAVTPTSELPTAVAANQLDPRRAGRVGDVKAAIAAARAADMPILFHCGSLYGWLRDWMGLENLSIALMTDRDWVEEMMEHITRMDLELIERHIPCLLYTSPSPRDGLLSRMPSSA